MSDIKFKASVDSKKGEVSLKNLDKGVGKVEKSTKRAAGGFKSLAVGVAAGVAAFAVASKALRGLIRWMGDAVDKAAIQQTAEKEVAAALESTGREVEANTEHFKEYASELQNATTFGDEQILSAQALMIQLTRLDREGLDMATKGAMGLASVYKTDLQAATTLVGKALAGNYGALSRYGIMVERTATDEEKRVSILQQLQTMYQRAEAEVDTYSGTMDQLSNVYGDLKEEMGKVVTENEDFRDTLKTITDLTKDLIDSGLVGWLTDVATEAILSMPMLESLAFSLGAILMIYKIQAEKKKKLDEITVEWFKHLELEDDLQIKLRGDIAAVIEVTEKQAEVTEKVVTQIQNLSMIKIDWEALKPPSELMDEWDKLFELVETPELDLAFEQFAISTEDNFANVMESMGFFVREHGEGIDEMKTQTKELSDFEQLALAEMMGSYQGIIGTILGVIEKWAIGEIVKSVMVALPFPINLLATAGAIAAVKAIFAGIRGGGETEPEGKAEGGWVGLHGEEIIKVGERGPEYVTPNRALEPLAPARKIEATFQANFFITSPDTMGWQRITREKIGPEFIEWIRLNKSLLLEVLEE